MRVVIDARMPDGQPGGVQQWVIGLAAALSKLESNDDEYLFLVDAGHEGWLRPYLSGSSRLLYPALRRRVARRARLTLRPIWRWAASVFPVLRRLRGQVFAVALRKPVPHSDGTIEAVLADVVHFPWQGAFLTDVPSLYQPWDLQHLHLPEFFTPEQREWREVRYRAFCDQAALIITASDWVKRDLVSQYGIDPGRIAVVNVPPATAAYAEPSLLEERDILVDLGLPERFVYFPAQTWPHKNHVRLFEALRELRDDNMVVPLVCSGQHNESFPQVQRAATALGIDADVRFLGYVDPVVVQVLYKRATALIFPTLYEGWGLPILEAFSNGLPVACSNVTSLPELVDGAALIFDPYDAHDIAAATRRLWTDQVLALELAERGRAVASRYDWRRTALVMRAYYRREGGQALSGEDLALLASA